MTHPLTGSLNSAKDSCALTVSLTPIFSGIVTKVNWVISGLHRIRRTCNTRRRNFSNSSFIFSPSLEPNIIALMPPVNRCILIILSAHFSIISGSARNRNVCPVGAVSNTITSHPGFSKCFSNSSKAMASSSPGKTISDASKSIDSPPSKGPKLSVSLGM